MPNILLSNASKKFEASQFLEAEQLCLQVLAQEAGSSAAFLLLSLIRNEQGRFDESLAFANQALEVDPDVAETRFVRGALLCKTGKPSEGLRDFQFIVGSAPNNPQYLNALGGALLLLQRYRAALAAFDLALVALSGLRPDPDVWFNRGVCLKELGRRSESIHSFQESLAHEPDDPVTLVNISTSLSDLGQYEEALNAAESALAKTGKRTKSCEALCAKAIALERMGLLADAMQTYNECLLYVPGHQYALDGMARVASNLCEWSIQAELAASIKVTIDSAWKCITPQTLLRYSEDPKSLHSWATTFTSRTFPERTLNFKSPAGSGQVRLAYLYPRLDDSPAARLIQDLCVRHDRRKFENFLVCWPGNDAISEIKPNSFDHIMPCEGRTDAEIAALLRSNNIDIAIDLVGHGPENRMGIFAHRGAALQISYFGYLGTSGASFIDYILADQSILPIEDQEFYSERIIHFPRYSRPDFVRRDVSPPAPPLRRTMGLPETGFIYCNFGAHWKITSPVYDVWMRLLHNTPGSILWLLDGPAAQNLKDAALARDIRPERVIFAPLLSRDFHLERCGAADLYLDTLPCNALWSAANAVREGVPLLTCPGRTMGGRISKGLLHRLDMPELVASSLKDYELKALRIAHHPDLLAALKVKLALSVAERASFDSLNFCREVEHIFLSLIGTLDPCSEG